MRLASQSSCSILRLLYAVRSDVDAAARLIGYVNARLDALEYEREPTEKWGYAKLTAALRMHRSEAEVEKLAAEGASWSEDHAVEEALEVTKT
jgi:hypothetical protein